MGRCQVLFFYRILVADDNNNCKVESWNWTLPLQVLDEATKAEKSIKDATCPPEPKEKKRHLSPHVKEMLWRERAAVSRPPGLFPCGAGGGRAVLLPLCRWMGSPGITWSTWHVSTGPEGHSHAAESPSEKFKGGILWLEMSVCDSRVWRAALGASSPPFKGWAERCVLGVQRSYALKRNPAQHGCQEGQLDPNRAGVQETHNSGLWTSRSAICVGEAISQNSLNCLININSC